MTSWFNFWLFSYFASLAILSAPSSIVLKTIGMFLLYYLHRTLIGKTCFNLLLTGNESEVVGAAMTSQKNGHTLELPITRMHCFVCRSSLLCTMTSEHYLAPHSLHNHRYWIDVVHLLISYVGTPKFLCGARNADVFREGADWVSRSLFFPCSRGDVLCCKVFVSQRVFLRFELCVKCVLILLGWVQFI
jgi:hypothetical protein